MSGPRIEAIYPLSPMQQGMLFHSLEGPATGVYVEQLLCGLRGDLDLEALASAWDRIAARHPVLRTAFVWEGLDRPVQAVHAEARVPFEAMDWRGMAPAEQDEKLEAFLLADRRRGFRLIEAPLLRVFLIRRGDDLWEMVWTHHHLLLDGWSSPIVIRELFEVYDARRRGAEARLPSVRPYRDYIGWLRRRDAARAEGFWRRVLDGVAGPTPIPLAGPSRPPSGSGGAGAEERLSVDAATLRSISESARAGGVTLNTLVQGAWAVLLSRYSGRDDVVFGTTVSGRPAELEGVESMVGLFINTIPLRARVDPAAPALPWLQDLQRSQAGAREFEQTPLADVQSWMGLRGGTRLFDSILVFENYPLDPALLERAGGLEVLHVRSVERTNYPITVAAFPSTELVLEITYERSRFEAASIRRMLGHLRTILVALAEAPDRPVGATPLLTGAESREILVAWSGSAEPADRPRLVHELFEEQAARSPEAPAVIADGETVAYREVDARADRIAARLREAGVGPDVVVGVFMERTPDLPAALLGILKAGGAFLPLDPAHPDARLAFMLEDSGCRVILTQARLAAELPEHGGVTLVVDGSEEPPRRAAGAGPGPGVAPDHLAYVIYTSGSTGRPKGVLIPHRGIANRLLWGQGAFPLGPGDRLLQKASLSFDVAVWECFAPLVAGAAVVPAPEAARRDTAALVRFIRERGITAVDFVPSLLRVFLEEDRVESCRSLRRVTCGGEVLTADLEDRFSARLGAALVNLYGPTETSVDATFHVCDPGTRRGIVPIGRPIGGVRVHILDECLRPVPEGIPGELCVGGEGVARGYLNRPDLTAERFVPDPWAASPGARLYRTGDRARWAAGGTIEFLGRTDHQVKIRGFRVELEEIEAALAGHPQIAACAAAAREEAPGELRLAAYVVPREGAAIAAGELRRWLKARLPDHMVPAAFVEMAALPLTPSGKVDLGALPAPGGARPAVEAAYVGPRTPAEEALARIWAGALGLDRVGVHDDFFELGGDSILAIQVVARARDAGLRLTPRQVFQNPTIAGLASVAGAARHASAEQGIVRGEVPLTPVQGWFFERGLPDPHHWNQPVLLDLRTPIEPAALERALQHLLVHHDALRLRFARGGRGWRQFHAGPEAGVPFTHVDLTSLPPGASRAALEARAAREQAGLDLAKGPLVRVALFELPAGARRLLIVAHHLVVDAVSWGVILADLEAAYRQLLDGDPVELPLKTTSFKDWAERLAAHAASGRLADEAAYWIDAARRGAPALPVDDPGGRNTEAAGARLTAALDAARSRALLGEAPSAYRMEAQEIVLAALARSLARWTGDSRVFLEIEGHGREPLFEDVDLSRTVGWFTSLHPVHLDLPGSGGPAALLKAVKEQLRAVPGRGIGYGLLRHLDGDGRVQEALRKAPQPQVAVNYLGRLDGALPRDAGFAWASEPAGPVYAPAGERSHLIEVNAGMTRGRLEVEWSYGAAVHRRATIEGLARSFTEELAALVDHCLSPEAGGYTPSDFPEAGLDQMELDALMARLGGGPRP